jgi:protein-S-isoprenylcysteine O-methyltransferase Ste14
MSDQQGTVTAATQDRSTFRLFKYGGIAVAFLALHVLPYIGPLLVVGNQWFSEHVYIPVNILIGIMGVLIAVKVMFTDRVNTGRTGWDARPGCLAGVIILISVLIIVIPIWQGWEMMNTWPSVIITGIFLSIGLSNWIANRK